MRIAPMSVVHDQQPNRGELIESIDPSDVTHVRPVESSDLRHFFSMQAGK
jgi:hypothetical protein